MKTFEGNFLKSRNISDKVEIPLVPAIKCRWLGIKQYANKANLLLC
jgi:hypothetical protein